MQLRIKDLDTSHVQYLIDLMKIREPVNDKERTHWYIKNKLVAHMKMVQSREKNNVTKD